MVTDIDAISNNLIRFYDMEDKSIIHVGAGGGQLISYALSARSILAVDPDPDAVAHLETVLENSGLKDRFTVVRGEFASVSGQADVVFFEFCLHEMADPAEALRHAQSLAPDIVVVDHLPDSQWAWCAGEEGKAARSWSAVRQHTVVREVSYEAVQHFETYQGLLSKIEVLGEPCIARIKKFSGLEDIRINMAYAMALIR